MKFKGRVLILVRGFLCSWPYLLLKPGCPSTCEPLLPEANLFHSGEPSNCYSDRNI